MSINQRRQPRNHRPFGTPPAGRSYSNQKGPRMPDSKTNSDVPTTDDAAVQAWRRAAERMGTLPRTLREVANVDEHGEPLEGGLSSMGRMLAEDMPSMDKIAEKMAREMIRRRRRAAAEAQAGKPADADSDDDTEVTVLEGAEAAAALRHLLGHDSGGRRRGNGIDADVIKAVRGWPALLASLGLIDPLRAAVAAAARALAEGIDGNGGNGGEAGGGEGGNRRGVRTGFSSDRMTADGVLQVELGGEPFVLLRGFPVMGGVAMSVTVGGEEMFDRIEPEAMLLSAAEGLSDVRGKAEADDGDIADYLADGVYVTPNRQTPRAPRASDADVPVSPAPAGRREDSGDTPGREPAGGPGAGDDQGASPGSNSTAPQPSGESGDAPGTTTSS